MTFVVYLIPYFRGGSLQLYCGHTNDAVRRWSEHCKRGFLGNKEKQEMRVISNHATKKLAMNEESRVKKLSRMKKDELYSMEGTSQMDEIYLKSST